MPSRRRSADFSFQISSSCAAWRSSSFLSIGSSTSFHAMYCWARVGRVRLFIRVEGGLVCARVPTALALTISKRPPFNPPHRQHRKPSPYPTSKRALTHPPTHLPVRQHRDQPLQAVVGPPSHPRPPHVRLPLERHVSHAAQQLVHPAGAVGQDAAAVGVDLGVWWGCGGGCGCVCGWGAHWLL